MARAASANLHVNQKQFPARQLKPGGYLQEVAVITTRPLESEVFLEPRLIAQLFKRYQNSHLL